MSKSSSVEKTVRDIRRHTRKKYNAEDKIRIVLEGLRGEDTIAELCRREGINPNLYYRWSKDFLEAGKKRLSGDTVREANSEEVKALRSEASALKETLGELVMENPFFLLANMVMRLLFLPFISLRCPCQWPGE